MADAIAKPLKETIELCRSLSTFRHTDPAARDVFASAHHHLQLLTGPRDETGWLIERNDDGRPLWFAFSRDARLADSWTDESARALRFARREDAENAIVLHAITALFPHVRATEHMWLAHRPTKTSEASGNG